MIRNKKEMKKDVRTNMRDGSGAVTITHLFTADELKSNTRLCAKLTVPPGASIGFHNHIDEEEVFYILSGRGKVDDNGQIREVVAGDAILTGGGAGHSIECISEEPLEVMAVIGCFN
jgi:mannose-6-phosphate isomerase-like protein (cupin superfamily)